MNVGSTVGTALLRGFYVFLCTTAAGAIAAYMSAPAIVGPDSFIDERNRIIFSLLTGLSGGLGALGFRGGVEAKVDSDRKREGDVKASDVGSS